MIDPRLLQQHFQKVQAKTRPQIPKASSIPDNLPPVSVHTFPAIISETGPDEITPEALTPHAPSHPYVSASELQEELQEVTQALSTLKQTLSQTASIDPGAVPAIEEEIVEPETLEEPELPATSTEEEYDPYGYYSNT